MNLLQFRAINPRLNIRIFMRGRWLPEWRGKNYVHTKRIAMRKWGRECGRIMGSSDPDKLERLADHMDSAPSVSCSCIKADEMLTAYGWWECGELGAWQSPDEPRFSVENGEDVCSEGRSSGEYYHCEQCNGLFCGSPEVTTCDTNDMYCGERCARRNGCMIDCDGDWRSEECQCGCCDEEDECDDDYCDDGIYSYSSYPGGLIGPGGDYNIGTEIEIEFKSESRRRAFISSINEGHTAREVFCKRDGSLGSYGIEAVTGYGQYADMVPVLKGICEKALAQVGRSHNTTTCGQHISVSRSNMTHEHQARFVVFFNLPDNQEYLKTFARRSQCSWARTDPGKATDTFIKKVVDDRGFRYGEKYEAVNFCHDSHLEVRIFKGTLRIETVLARMALVALVAEYCKSDLTAKELTSIKFLQWMKEKDCELSTVIKQYLVHREAAVAERALATV